MYQSLKMKVLGFSILLCSFTPTDSSEIVLFPSSGCYSHDVMMREVGLEFPKDNVSWVQIYLYEFGFGEAKLPQTWNKFLINRATDDGKDEFLGIEING